MSAATRSGSVCSQRGQCLYRGFRLEQRADFGWSVKPVGVRAVGLMELGEPFTTPPSSLADVQALIDWHLGQAA